MSKNNQVLSIKEFIISNENNILINRANDDISMFYLFVIKYFADNEGLKININNDKDPIVNQDDLFGTKTIQTFSITNAAKLDYTLNTQSKKIIFTDYKNYKRLSPTLNSINGYQFENDIVFFIRNELNISNDELIYYCKNNTALLFSETSKFLVNSDRYSRDRSIIEDKNYVLDIRKSIFEIKRNNFNIKNLYQNIKKEAEYKKLSFLTF